MLTTKLNWLALRPEVEVWVVTLREVGEPFFPLEEGVRRHILDVPSGNKQAYRCELASVLAEIKPDVTLAVAGMSVDVLPAISNGGKKVLEFHYTKDFLVNFVKGISHIRFRQLHLLKMRYLQWRLACQARKFDKFVGLTRRDVGLWGNPENMTFIHNPLSFRSKRKSDCQSRTIIAVGSWTPAKGMDQLLEAFGPLAADFPDWRVELYGSGQDEQRLRNIIARYRMEQQVSLSPPVKNIAERLCAASIYAFPSRSDGFGLVITEAMECGLPTVAMDCPCGPCEILTPETGIVVPEQDIPAFRDALLRLMSSPALRVEMGDAASRAVTRFYPDVIMPKWIELFKELLA